MATIDLNNLIRPKNLNYKGTNITKQVATPSHIFRDLHLDLSVANSVGIGVNPSQTNDIVADYDIDAIKRSLKNIFTTRKGQKLLSPEFGCSLDAYLFEPVSDLGAKALGETINNAIAIFEPRVTVININVSTNPNYIGGVQLVGNTLMETIQMTETQKLLNRQNSATNYGDGYGIRIIYQINESKLQQIFDLIALLGGQIIY